MRTLGQHEGTRKLTLMGSVEKSTVLRRVFLLRLFWRLGRLISIRFPKRGNDWETEIRAKITSEKLHDKSRRHDERDSELHERSSVGREDDSEPVERIGGVGGHDS